MWKYTQREFNRRLYEHAIEPGALFCDLKLNATGEEVQKVLRTFRSASNPYHKFAFGNPLPSSYQSIGMSPPTYAVADTWEGELLWHSHTLKIFSDEITAFLQNKSRFEASFMKSDFEAAEEHLNLIEKNAVSLWSLDARFLLLEYRFGLEKNKQFLSELNATKPDGIITFLADLSSQRAEKKMSATRFKMRVAGILQTFRQHDCAAYADFLAFHLCFLEGDAPLNVTNVLCWAWDQSVFDRYLISLQVSQVLAARHPEARAALYGIWLPVAQRIQDPILSKLLVYCNPEKCEVNDAAITPLLPAIDFYTTGNYRDSLSLSQKISEEQPWIPAALELVAKSRAQMGNVNDADTLLTSDSPICTLLQRVLLSIYSRKGNVLESQRQLLKLAYSLRNFPLAVSLFALCREDAASAPDVQAFRVLRELNDNFHNPRYAEIVPHRTRALEYLEALGKARPKSDGISFRREIQAMLCKEAVVQINTPVPTVRALEYTAYVHQHLGRHAEAIPLLRKALGECHPKNDTENLFATEKILRALVFSLMTVGQLRECLEAVVDAYFQNKWLVSVLPLHALLNKIHEDEAGDTAADIRVPILCHIKQDGAQVMYVAYDNFLSAHHVDRPSSLFERKSELEKRELVYFLGKVCVPEVMSFSIHFASTKELEEERIRICRFLVEEDSQNRSLYADEISQITQGILTREGVQEIEQSKIYVDVNGLKSSMQRVLKEGFERYREISDFADEKQLHLVETNFEELGLKLRPREQARSADTSIKQPNDLRQTGQLDGVNSPAVSDTGVESETPRLYFLTRPSHTLFKELFLEIRDQFIASNEYGLDSYLSVRIRHGTLLGQLRRPFELHHLITQKDQNTHKYVDNPHWSSDSPHSPEIQTWLARLSQLVDQITMAVKEKWIQITTEKKSGDGMFDFAYGELEVLELYQNLSSMDNYEQFLNAAISELWQRTESNLDALRKRISSELRDEFVRMLTNLLDDVRKLPLETPKVAELSRAILTCRTDIQHELDSIAKWFTISTPRATPQSSLRHLLDTTISIINTTYPNVSFNPELDLPEGVNIQGVYFAAFVDVFLLLFDNIRKHSKLPPAQWSVRVSVLITDTEMIISSCNNLAESVDVEEALKKIAAISERFRVDSGLQIVRSEGGTGFAKLYKLLKYDLHREEYGIAGSQDTTGNERRLEITISMNKNGLL